ncbi:MAG: twin-arginine translocase TatA/TatE family subunit [Candidatus Zixiibacteriota bacterium]|nr:MAG: twin-arginine translocase TatA/TatE family subunit [candidate division Zixibacteria bacterium]
MFGGLGMQELLVIFLIILLLFGAKRIPDIAQGLGRGIRDFKKAMKDTSDEVTKSAPDDEKGMKSDNSSDKKE